MKTTLPNQIFTTTLFILIALVNSNAQVGIGTINPDPSSLLHIDNGDGNKGLLIPSVELTASNIGNPITPAPAQGLLVYNTVTAGSGNTIVVPGYHFWNGSQWTNIQDNDDKWDIDGNTGTDENVNYVGTFDDEALMFRTHHIPRFKIGTTNQVFAMRDGNSSEPFYSWDKEQSMGFFRAGTHKLALAIENLTFFQASANTSSGAEIEWAFNPNGEAIDFRVETDNNINSLFVSGEEGTIGVGSLPYNDTALRINNSAEPYGLVSETNGSGVAIYGIEVGAGTAIVGENHGTGIGVFGYAANTHGMYATTAYTGGSYLTGGMIGWGTGNNNANGVLAVTDKQASSSSNVGIRAVSGSTTSISKAAVLNIGVNTNATDLGLYAMTEGPINSGGSLNNFDAATFQTNYENIASDADARDPQARLAGFVNSAITPLGTGNTYYGAYLYSGGSSSNPSYAYAGARHNGVNYKIIGNGVVSTIVEGPSENATPKIMFAPEAPEVLFEDYGTAQLINGTARILIDPTFSNNITVNNEHPLKVFIQLEGDCNGVYVTNKSSESFTVKELKAGSSNTPFSWHIVANRKSEQGSNSRTSSDYSNLRFPDAPKAHLIEALDVKQLQEEKETHDKVSSN